MKITERKNEGLYHEFAIEVPPQQVQAHIQKRLQEIGKKVKLDGFRPGKAPLALLEQRYGDSARAEALEKTLQEATSKALKENNIKPALQPKVDVTKFDNDNTLEFILMVEKLPVIEPKDFKAIKLDKPIFKSADSEIDEAIGRIADNHKTSQSLSPQRPAKMGDVVRMNFDGSSHGKKLPGMKAKEFDLELGTNMFVDTFETQLVGAKTGDKLNIDVNFPADYRHPDLAGQPATFEVEVLDVRESVAPALDDELAKKVGLKSMDELKNAIRSQMDNQYDAHSHAKVKRALLDALDENNKFTVPNGMIENEYEQIWHFHIDDVRKRGLDVAKAEADEDSKAEFRKIAERRVRLGLLLSEVGERNSIKVTNQELQQAVLQEAYKYRGQEQEVIKYFQKNPQAINQLRAPLYEEKVVDFILSQIQLNEKSVSKEELLHDPDAEHEHARVTQIEGEGTNKKSAAKKK